MYGCANSYFEARHTSRREAEETDVEELADSYMEKGEKHYPASAENVKDALYCEAIFKDADFLVVAKMIEDGAHEQLGCFVANHIAAYCRVYAIRDAEENIDEHLASMRERDD